MSRLHRAVAAILAASLGAVLLASPAQARYDNPEAPTTIDEVRRDLGRVGRATKWRPRRLVTLTTGAGRLGAWVPYEPAALGGTARLRVLFNGYSLGANPGDGSDLRLLEFQVRNDCRTASGVTYTTEEWVARSSRFVWYGQNDGELLTGHTGVDSPSIGCGADSMVGLRVRLALIDVGDDTVEVTSDVIRWHIDNPNRGPEPPETWDLDFCEATFGPPPWAPGDQGVLWGQPIKIEDTPCLDLQEDWATDFDKVCANAPEFEFYQVLGLSVFPTMESLGAWIGHYARCLFKPEGGFDTTPIGEAADGGWMGATRTILASVAGDFGGAGAAGMTTPASGMGPPVMGGVTFADEDLARTFLGDAFVDNLNETQVPASPVAFGPSSTTGCGPFVEELPVVGKGVSSCSLAGVWPASFRTAAGALLMITAAFAALFAILRFMGVRYGWQTG